MDQFGLPVEDGHPKRAGSFDHKRDDGFREWELDGERRDVRTEATPQWRAAPDPGL